MRKVYLLWQSYISEELMPIGVLTDIGDNQYSFTYFPTAKTAYMNGCFLPFPYTEKPYFFVGLPHFFEQRILKGEFNQSKFGLSDKGHKFDCLIYMDSIKNSDNFSIVNEEGFASKGF